MQFYVTSYLQKLRNSTVLYTKLKGTSFEAPLS